MRINYLVRRQTFVSLDIEGGCVRLAQAEDRAGARRIIKLKVRELASASENDVVEALTDIFKELKKPVGPLTICIPRHKTTVRFLRLPTTKEKEIAGMVKFQSAKELPFSKEEIISDHLITEITKDGFAKVALVIAHQDEISGYLNILKKAGLEPARITFSTEAVLSWYRVISKPGENKDCQVLIDLEIDNTDIVIVENLQLRFTRGISWGIRQLQQQPELKTKLLEEIKLTIEAYNRYAEAKHIEQVFICQNNEVTKSLKGFLEQSLNLPCEIVTAATPSEGKRKISAMLYEAGLSLPRVFGMALNVKGKQLNLLPAALREKQRHNLQRRKVKEMALTSMLIIFLAFLIFAKKIYQKEIQISLLAREISRSSFSAQQVEKMLNAIKLIESRRTIEGSTVDILRELHALTPAQISFSSLYYEKNDKTAIIQGSSTNIANVSKFIEALEQSAYFKNVQLKYVSGEKAILADSTNFKIECTLEK